jgi:predicted RNase H-like HicB family nuclease
MKTLLTSVQNEAKTHFFKVEVAEEDDGRWSAWIDALPGCAAWGYTPEEALQAIGDAAALYIEDMLEAGDELPRDVMVMDTPGIVVTV